MSMLLTWQINVIKVNNICDKFEILAHFCSSALGSILPFPSLEMKKGASSYSLTQTVHRPTESNKGKWRKYATSNYIIGAGIIWAWIAWVDCALWCGRPPNHIGEGGPFLDPSLSEESRNEKSGMGVGFKDRGPYSQTMFKINAG